ncbi:MAG: hypothetical protein ACREAA_10680 [Candidatus Polarisedimenticolia bacterium]
MAGLSISIERMTDEDFDHVLATLLNDIPPDVVHIRELHEVKRFTRLGEDGIRRATDDASLRVRMAFPKVRTSSTHTPWPDESRFLARAPWGHCSVRFDDWDVAADKDGYAFVTDAEFLVLQEFCWHRVSGEQARMLGQRPE